MNEDSFRIVKSSRAIAVAESEKSAASTIARPSLILCIRRSYGGRVASTRSQEPLSPGAANKPRMQAPVKLRTISHFIRGKAYVEDSARFGDVYDPPRGEVRA